jgi:hypothetical protein
MRPNIVALYAILCLAGCAHTHQPRPVAVEQTPQEQKIATEVSQLRQDMAREVPGETPYTAPENKNWVAHAQAIVAVSPYKISNPQTIIAVDRNPDVQQLRVIVANPHGQWQIIGGGKVSTGIAGVPGHYITPTGVFPHTSAILDYRALGTYNENNIRGLGETGRRVWDFGWQIAEEGWSPDHKLAEIRLAMHATDPDYLEPLLGHPESEGCVRVSAAMNVFLDRHAILDADYLQAANTDPSIAAVLPADGDPTPLAGMYLVVFDSTSASQAPPRSPDFARTETGQ